MTTRMDTSGANIKIGLTFSQSSDNIPSITLGKRDTVSITSQTATIFCVVIPWLGYSTCRHVVLQHTESLPHSCCV